VTIGNRPIPPGPKRGEIYRFDLRDVGGHVISGPHYAVIVQTNELTRSSTTLVAPITSNAASAHLSPEYLVPVSAGDISLGWSGYIHADQIFTLPSAEAGQRIGLLPAARVDELDQALAFVLGLA